MEEKNRRQSKYLIAIILALVLCSSCGTDLVKSKKRIIKNKQCDIEYLLPIKISTFISDSIISDKNVIYLTIDIDNDNVTCITFTYSELDSKKLLLAQMTKRYLVLNQRKIPILFETDFNFSTVENDNEFYIQDFNYAYLAFDDKENILEVINFNK